MRIVFQKHSQFTLCFLAKILHKHVTYNFFLIYKVLWLISYLIYKFFGIHYKFSLPAGRKKSNYYSRLSSSYYSIELNVRNLPLPLLAWSHAFLAWNVLYYKRSKCMPLLLLSYAVRAIFSPDYGYKKLILFQYEFSYNRKNTWGATFESRRGLASRL